MTGGKTSDKDPCISVNFRYAHIFDRPVNKIIDINDSYISFICKLEDNPTFSLFVCQKIIA